MGSDLNTVGAVIEAVLDAVVLDLATGKATKIWTSQTLQQRLEVSPRDFSAWRTGRRIPPLDFVQRLLDVVKEMGVRGEHCVAPLMEQYRCIELLLADPDRKSSLVK